VQTDSVANYHALQATLERRFSKGFTLMSNYTWAHAIDDTQTTAGGKPGNGPYPQLVNKPNPGASALRYRRPPTLGPPDRL
jgi:hypothetical protein